ncbi:MAG: zinc ABC transporter substrate-binding protein [Eubacterium sp.]|nr:zinc ABC transporter substrate-binding protein [Eubacterium sp.]
MKLFKLLKNKYMTAAMLSVLCFILFTGCGSTDAMATVEAKENGKAYSIVCTTYPQYDWLLNVLGSHADNYSVSLLLDNGTDLHSYQPSVDDIAQISNSDLFIYVGGESDAWVDGVLKTANNPELKTINLLESIGDSAVAEELKEGMQVTEDEEDEEDEHHHEDSDEDDHDEEEGHHHDDREIEYDEHIWLSLKNAEVLTGIIRDAVCGLDPENADDYKKNADDYISRLDELDKKYEEAVSSAKDKTLIFCDRFPFRYMVEDYGLDYYAAFIGCSAESEASFETITFLAGKVDELGVDTVFVIENSDQKIAKTVIENTNNKNQEIAVLNSVQSVTEKDLASGKDYYSIMEDNLEVLKKGLD